MTSPTAAASPSPPIEPYFRTVDRALSGNEGRLISQIPQDVAADCLPFDGSGQVQGELAAIVCRPADMEVLYRLFAEPTSMDASFQVNANTRQAPAGECATDHLAMAAYTVGDQPAGRVLCYTTESQPFDGRPASSHIEWTDENSAIYAHAIRNDLSDLALYGWWQSSAGPVVDDTAAKDLPASAGPLLREGSYLVSIVEPGRRRSVALRDARGRPLVTYRIHIEEGTYELGRDGKTIESGDILLQKPNAIAFHPQTGHCAGTGPSSALAAYEWSSVDRSLTWMSGGRCAGPKAVPRSLAWTRAPQGVIAFATAGDASVTNVDSEIALMDAAGFEVERLTGEAETRANASPIWSAEGAKIVFAGGGLDGFDLYTMNADGTGVARLTNEAGDEHHPALSPDGSRIVLVHESVVGAATRDSVVVIDPDGGGWTELVNRENERLGWPEWSPDGRRIAFVGRKGRRFNIYVMSADGGDVTKVRQQPSGPLFGLGLTWTPRWETSPLLGIWARGTGDAPVDAPRRFGRPRVRRLVPGESLHRRARSRLVGGWPMDRCRGDRLLGRPHRNLGPTHAR